MNKYVLKKKIEYHEELLINPSRSTDKGVSRRLDKLEVLLEKTLRRTAKANMAKPSKPARQRPFTKKKAHTHLVGSRKDMPDFKGKPLDHVVSKGKTPEMKGARPCVYCKSGKHWDNDCPLNKKKTFRNQVKSNLASADEEGQMAQAEYESLQELHEFDSSPDTEDSEYTEEDSDKDPEAKDKSGVSDESDSSPFF
ncbi:hypothetical protein RSAG8_04148, partial [Rhizoctonia solani AG-8 WAC10335]